MLDIERPIHPHSNVGLVANAPKIKWIRGQLGQYLIYVRLFVPASPSERLFCWGNVS
jgi:hypothetical protein